MYKKLQYISFLLFITAYLHSHSPSFYFGTIRSTNGLISTPIPYYYRGSSGLLMAYNGLITFEIPATSGENKLYLLVTDLELRPVPEQGTDGSIIFNTFQHLELQENASYRFFILERSNEGTWSISEEKLEPNRTVPDHTIVLLYFPELISSISGGSTSELPTVFVKPLPDESESHELQSKISERLVKMHLSAINLNTIHTPIKQLKHHKNNKILIAHYV